MGSGISSHQAKMKEMKDTKNTHNIAFDLIDTNGDQIIYKNELDIFSEWFHKYMIEVSKDDHNSLVKKDHKKYLYDVLGKMYGKPLKKRDFYVIGKMIPNNVWKEKAIPILRESEIKRLQTEHKTI